MSIDLEYAIKQDIRNNPVVREVDREHRRETYRTIGLGAVIVGMLLFAAFQQYKIVDHGINVERIRQELAAEEALHRRLRLQFETLTRPELIERRALRELGMVRPTPDQITVVERVPGRVPPRAVVAEAR